MVFSKKYFFAGLVFNFPIILLMYSEQAGFSSILMMLSALYLIVIKKNIKFNYSFLFFLLLFIVVFTLSSLSTVLGDYTQYKLVNFIYKIMMILLVVTCLDTIDKAKSFIASIVVVSLFILFFSISYFPLFLELSINSRLEIGSVNPIWIARYAVEGFIVSLLIVKKKLITIMCFVIMVLTAALAGSKGPVLSLLVAISFSAYIKNPKYLIYVGAVLLVSFIMLFASMSLLPDYAQEYFFQRFTRTVPIGTSYELLIMSREYMWPYTISYIYENPLVLLAGVGFGGFGELYGYEGIRLYPHNIFLEILVETGIFGLIVFVFFLFRYLKVVNFAGVLAIFYLVNSQFSGDIINNERLFLFVLLSYRIYVLAKKNKSLN